MEQVDTDPQAAKDLNVNLIDFITFLPHRERGMAYDTD